MKKILFTPITLMAVTPVFCLSACNSNKGPKIDYWLEGHGITGMAAEFRSEEGIPLSSTADLKVGIKGEELSKITFEPNFGTIYIFDKDEQSQAALKQIALYCDGKKMSEGEDYQLSKVDDKINYVELLGTGCSKIKMSKLFYFSFLLISDLESADIKLSLLTWD